MEVSEGWATDLAYNQRKFAGHKGGGGSKTVIPAVKPSIIIVHARKFIKTASG